VKSAFPLLQAVMLASPRIRKSVESFIVIVFFFDT
jgi:hypothetical protein